MSKITVLSVCLVCLILPLMAVERDMVVVEIGTGTWCQYCPGAAMGADDLVENHHRAAIVENHNGDNYANTFSNARNTYYNVTGFPTAFFDGLNPTVGGSHTESMYSGYRNKVNARLNVPSNYTISATGSHSGLVYNIVVTVSKVSADTNTNIRLHGVLTESGIQYSWQGQTHLEFVNRLMVPDASGTPVDFSANPTQTFNLTFTANSAWNPDNFEFVFFLQNNTTKETLQGCKYKVEALENVNPLSVTAIDFGNVSADQVSSQTFTLHNWWTQDMNISISSDNFDYFVTPHTRDDYTIPFLEDMSFDVMLLPSHGGADNGTLTITTDNPAYPVLTVALTANVTTANDEAQFVPLPNGLLNIYPNPFRTAASIKYSLKPSDLGYLQIYNVKGEKVNEQRLSGSSEQEHTVFWNGQNMSGENCSAGIYFCRITVNGKTEGTRKLLKLQ